MNSADNKRSQSVEAADNIADDFHVSINTEQLKEETRNLTQLMKETNEMISDDIFKILQSEAAETTAAKFFEYGEDMHNLT